MYRVLLADDEPIILSGLQSMLSWEELSCAVAGVARNGRQALEFIEEHRPDIVVCDINMPLLSGLELLEHCAREFPEVVFVMLTNHDDFHMAQQSLRGRAVDYLLKIDLDEEKLSRSVALAIRERDKRQKLYAPGPAAREPSESTADGILRHAAALLFADGGEEAASALGKYGADRNCAAALLVMDPSRIPGVKGFTGEERARLFSFHQKLVEDVAQRLFDGAGYVLPPRGGEGSIPIFFWNLERAELLERFQAKLSATLGEISQMRISLLATEVLSGQELAELPAQLAGVRSEFAVSPRSFLRYTRSRARADYVSAAMEYVERHIFERVSVQDAAAAVGITPNYLSSLFKRQLAQNFMDYVNAAKVKRACALLRDKNSLVYEVSHMLGYDNAYYFTKVFKRYMKMTPSEYQALPCLKDGPDGQTEQADV